MFNLQLRFHPKEEWFPTDKNFQEVANTFPVYWKHSDDYMFYGKKYKCVDYVIYYRANGAIGLFGVSKTNKNFGYHDIDIERIRILHDGVKPLYIYLSAHAQEGGWSCVYADKLPNGKNSRIKIVNNLIVVYVAKWSHAMYADAKKYVRILGLANDETSDKGLWKKAELINDNNAYGIHTDIQNREVLDTFWKRFTLPLQNIPKLKDQQMEEQTKNNK
jgi:hypothetical protein